MAKPFAPETEIQKAIVKGDHQALLAALRPLRPADREKLRSEVMRVVKAMKSAMYAYDDKTFAGWGRRPTEKQNHAAAVASLLCGTAEDVADQWYDIDQLMAVGREFSPPALRELATELMKARAWQSHIHDAQLLIGAGLSQRPDCDEYVLGLMLLFSSERRDSTTFEKLFAQDPGLKHALLRILEVEGTRDVSLTSVDKYIRRSKSWAERLVELSEQGVYPRALLIDKALSALERGWIQYRSGWFSSFHELLSPTVAEMRPHTARYLALLGSRIPPTVTFALDCVGRLVVDEVVSPREACGALRPVFASAVKGQIETALKLLDRAVKVERSLATQAMQIAVPALAHENAQLQAAVLRRLAEWEATPEVRASLAAYASGIAAVNREAFKALSGAAKDAAPKARSPISPAAAASKSVGLRNPLDAEFAVAPIDTLDELVERVAYGFENDTDSDEFERAVAGLVRFAPFDAAARARFAPVAKRIPRIRKPVAHQLARLLHFFMTGDRFETPHTQNYFGHPNLLARYLGQRVDDLMKLSESAAGNVPLATPTHRHGFIDPAELARRLGRYQARGVAPSRMDFLGALMRIATPGDGAALAAARNLKDDNFARALRLALGEELKLRAPELLSAASRMRRVFVRNQPASRSWKAVSKKFTRGGAGHLIVEIEQSEAHDSTDPVATLEHEASRIEADGWYEFGAVGSADEGSIRHYATLLPADLENFCAEGVALMIRNIDWWQAHWEHKAYLRPLLLPTAAMGPMATLLLAVGMAAKEAGEAALAVDALVQASIDGRLDTKLLAHDVAELVRTEMVACARYAKSLRAALRIEPGIAPVLAEILCAAIAARPADPPKDTAALLELLLEIVVANELVLSRETRVVLEAMQIGGRGKALRTKLLALPA